MGRNSVENSTINENYSRKLIRGTVHATVGIDSPKRFIQQYGKNMNRVELLRLLEKESKFKIWWYAIFLSFIVVFACFYPESYLGLIELAVLMVAIDLTSRGKIIGVIVSVFECVLYSWISYQSGLIGEVIKNLAIGVPLNIYTIISWSINAKKNKMLAKERKYKVQESADIVVKKLSKKMLFVYFGLTILASILSYFLLKYALGQEVSLIPSALVLGSMLIYKILNGARYMESWYFGILQATLAMFMWIVTMVTGSATILQLPMIAVTIACLSNNIYGFIMWKALYRRVAVNGGELLSKRSMSIKRVIKIRRRFKSLHWNKSVDISKNS